MRYLYVIICGLGSGMGAHAQAPGPAATGQLAPDSVWYEATPDNRRVSSATDSVGTCTEVLRWEGPGGLVRIFYPSGHLKEYVPYADLAAGSRHGVATSWYNSGQLSSQQPYWQGQRTGTLLLYYENGALKRSTQYVAGNELPGQCFDPSGHPLDYFPYEQLPLYPGGYTQLSKEISRALRVPRQLRPAYFLEPRVVDIVFEVAEDGSIHEPRVARSSQLPGLDQAVLAAIAKLTRRFHPGRRDGRIVACAYHVPVEFKLPLPLQPARKL